MFENKLKIMTLLWWVRQLNFLFTMGNNPSLKKDDFQIITYVQIPHNYILTHMGINNETLADRAGIKLREITNGLLWFRTQANNPIILSVPFPIDSKRVLWIFQFSALGQMTKVRHVAVLNAWQSYSSDCADCLPLQTIHISFLYQNSWNFVS